MPKRKNANEYHVTRKQVVDAALSYRSVKFLHQGRSRETGVDCCGFIEGVLQEVGYPNIVDVRDYPRSPAGLLVAAIFHANFDEIPLHEVGLGDIFLMRIGASREARHASILVSDVTDYDRGLRPEIAHTYAQGLKGKVVVEPLEFWQKNCLRGFRLRGLID